MTDLLAVIYSEVLKNSTRASRNFPVEICFILSKGHACAALYAALALKEFFPVEELKEFGRDGSRLMTHVSHKVPGVEIFHRLARSWAWFCVRQGAGGHSAPEKNGGCSPC